MPHVRCAHLPALEDIDPSVKVATAAAILDYDESLVRKEAKANRLRWHRVGKTGVRIYLSSIEEYRRQRSPDPGNDDQSPTTPLTRRKAKKSAAYREAETFLRSLGLLD